MTHDENRQMDADLEEIGLTKRYEEDMSICNKCLDAVKREMDDLSKIYNAALTDIRYRYGRQL